MEHFTVENSKEAKQTIEQIRSAKDDIFVFAYDPERSDTVTAHTNAKRRVKLDLSLSKLKNVNFYTFP